uniref:DNA-directed RNA polymerase subunit n=1 Tax=Rhipiliopsis peltata TaxID=2320810 RepID=A0A386B172_9CHLO|nr:RNA polymerase b-subunit [Rhipiliopsis peltata]AYC65440.1 RNA polymerase b-subunit [Rhipiliopsis peltata]
MLISKVQFPGLRLRLAPSKLIRQWAQRELPNGKKISGQIFNPKTVHYQTLKPEKDGLFCERIFGPIDETTCACGRKPLRGQKFCPRCEVEYISARVRRYRLGYIQLVTAAAHTWFFKGQSCYFSLFLNLSKKKIECLLYCTENISRTIFPQELEFWGFPPIQQRGSFPIQRSTKALTRSPNIRPFISKMIYIPKESNFRKYPNILPKFSRQISLFAFRRFRIFSRNLRKKSLWQSGGLRDSALYFGVSLISKMCSWEISANWFSFIYFLISVPQKGDQLNKYYPGPPGLVNFFGKKSRLFCFTGVQLIRTWLCQLAQYECNDGKLLELQIRVDLVQLDNGNGIEKEKENGDEDELTQKIHLFRRLKYLRSLRSCGPQINPASMVLSVLPVLPPDLRPILKLDKDQMAVSDLNRLYQMVILRTRRLARLTIEQDQINCLNSEALQYAQRLLQESVDSLIENNGNSINKSQIKTKSTKSTKSLSDLFKGKKGRFRQNLLGKRVDYSGRSVIVVGPDLKISECGLPKEIAYELFQPFLLRNLLFQKKAQTIFGAKKLLRKKPPFVWNLLKEIVHSHPILLNRAPTLHRLSIQAFQPQLIEGKAILLHPLVCAAFNADFDGDQMGIHLPLCFEARAEAWKITWSQNNLFSAATGGISCSPSQDMILGSSFLTAQHIQPQLFNEITEIPNFQTLFRQKPVFFKNGNDIQEMPKSICFAQNSHSYKGDGGASHCPTVYFHSIWVNSNPIFHCVETDKKRQKLIEIRLNFRGYFQKFRPQFCEHYHPSGAQMFRKIRTTYGRIKFYQISL